MAADSFANRLIRGVKERPWKTLISMYLAFGALWTPTHLVEEAAPALAPNLWGAGADLPGLTPALDQAAHASHADEMGLHVARQRGWVHPAEPPRTRFLNS